MQQEPLPVEIDFSLVWVIALFFALQLTATAMLWGVGALRNALQSRRRDAELRTTAKDLGLEHGRSMLGMLAVEGIVSGFMTRLEAGRGGIHVRIWSSRLPRGGFAIWEVEPATVRTGDDAFDGRCFARGAPVEIASRLDERTRAWFARRRATCIEGTLSFYVRLGEGRLTEDVREALAIAEHLASAALAPSLGAIVAGDPIPEVRANAETVLTQALPASAEAHAVFRGWLANPRCAPRQRQRAQLFLEDVPPLDEEQILSLLLDRDAEPVLRRLLVIVRHTEVLLARLVPRVLEGHAAQILTELAASGSAACVEPLLRASMLPGSALAAQVTGTIERVQQRLEGASRGQLAISDRGGELAIDRERGAVAIAVRKVE